MAPPVAVGARLQTDAASCARRASTVFDSSMVMVIGPTPPGTGVIQAAFSRAESKSTSPHSLPSGRRLMPTSMTTAPGLIMSPVTMRGLPVATTRTSARRVWLARSRVFEVQIVTVALRLSSMIAIGLPTMLLRPTTTASLPCQLHPDAVQHRHAPSRRAGRKAGFADHQAAHVLDVKAVDVLRHGRSFRAPSPRSPAWAAAAAPECRGCGDRR